MSDGFWIDKIKSHCLATVSMICLYALLFHSECLKVIYVSLIAIIFAIIFYQYETEDDAKATRQALHGTRWPSSNPKILRVDFSNDEEVGVAKELFNN